MELKYAPVPAPVPVKEEEEDLKLLLQSFKKIRRESDADIDDSSIESSPKVNRKGRKERFFAFYRAHKKRNERSQYDQLFDKLMDNINNDNFECGEEEEEGDGPVDASHQKKKGYYFFTSDGKKIPNKWDAFDVDAALNELDGEEGVSAGNSPPGNDLFFLQSIFIFSVSSSAHHL